MVIFLYNLNILGINFKLNGNQNHVIINNVTNGFVCIPFTSEFWNLTALFAIQWALRQDISLVIIVFNI